MKRVKSLLLLLQAIFDIKQAVCESQITQSNSLFHWEDTPIQRIFTIFLISQKLANFKTTSYEFAIYAKMGKEKNPFCVYFIPVVVATAKRTTEADGQRGRHTKTPQLSRSDERANSQRSESIDSNHTAISGA